MNPGSLTREVAPNWARTSPARTRGYVCQTPRRAWISLWVAVGQTPNQSLVSVRLLVLSLGMISIWPAVAVAAGVVIRSGRGIGAAGMGVRCGSGVASQTQSPSLAGHVSISTGPSQHDAATRSTAHASWPHKPPPCASAAGAYQQARLARANIKMGASLLAIGLDIVTILWAHYNHETAALVAGIPAACAAGICKPRGLLRYASGLADLGRMCNIGIGTTNGGRSATKRCQAISQVRSDPRHALQPAAPP